MLYWRRSAAERVEASWNSVSGVTAWPGSSAGVSAGVDLALHVVQLLAGQETRDRTAAEMEWMWQS